VGEVADVGISLKPPEYVLKDQIIDECVMLPLDGKIADRSKWSG